ncbi:uncharacterized protein EV420DRAFT_1478299 [Desarmillaria tabescens]|uniref:Uncharacterized protein n=1 Tax=Armillaria tabescens TaxID=1929756 RepID=A0AA39TIX7_ARMTA|nr:uncharacterized protein EV420DRAFT_1478299 [Desarmillaria tabescens]KAK0460527.1 hypothetical protein EV420DRAFT_1478299 [Desarmillaria tabescens]
MPANKLNISLRAVKTSFSNIRALVGPKAAPPIPSHASLDVGMTRPLSSSFSLRPGELTDTSSRSSDRTPAPSSTLPSSLYNEGQVQDPQPPPSFPVDDNEDIPDLMVLLEGINIQAGPASDTCLMFSDTFNQSTNFLDAIIEAARLGCIDEVSTVENIQRLYQHISTTGMILKFLICIADHMAHLESAQRVALEFGVRRNQRMVLQWLSCMEDEAACH